MSTAFLITLPLMLLAVVIAVAPVLLVSVGEHRRSHGREPRPVRPVPSPTTGVAPPPAAVAERQAAIAALEGAALAVHRLKAQDVLVGAGGERARLDQATDDLHRALVSLGGAVR